MVTQDPSERRPNRRSSERRQADKAAREYEERYGALFDSLDCVYLHDFEGRFLDANPAALKLLGYERGEILSLSFPSLLDDDQLALAQGVVAELKETGAQKALTEFRLRCKTGEYVCVETKSSAIFRDGQPYAVLGVGRDITERKHAEEALQESQKRFQALIETTSDFIWEIDADGVYTYCSPHTMELWGYKPEDMIGRSSFDVMLPEDKEHAIAMFRAMSESPSLL